MPVIRVYKWDLERLLGKTLSKEEILDLLPRIKCEVEEIGEDGLIEYEATHDRPDLYSVEGLARALRFLLGVEHREYVFVDEGVKTYNLGVPRRPYVAFAIVRDLELDEEAVKQIMQLQEKLATTYGRSRRKASIGVYDLDTFKLPVYYELVDPEKTKFIPLNDNRIMNLREILAETEKGREYGHLLEGWDKLPILRDSEGKILSMPPIINSEDTKVTEETKNVLIDSTGIDPKTVIDMVTIMATSIAERSRSRKIVYVDTVNPDGTVTRAPRSQPKELKLNISYAESIIGMKISVDEAIKLLKKMEITPGKTEDQTIIVYVPPYRLDILEEIDLVEELAVAIGYDVIGGDADSLPPAYHPGRIHPLEHLSRRFRSILVGLGYVEVTNYMMSNPAIQLGIFGISDEDMILVKNPKMDKYTGLRRWLTPGLLEVILENKEKLKDIRVFEIGDVAIPDKESETGAIIERRLGIAISHEKATLTDGLAVINALFNRFSIKPVYEKKYVKGFLKERTASIIINGEEVGFVGEIDPRILYRLGMDRPVVSAEIILNKVLILINH